MVCDKGLIEVEAGGYTKLLLGSTYWRKRETVEVVRIESVTSMLIDVADSHKVRGD